MAALENEVLRNSKPSLDHSFLSPDKLGFSAPSVDRTLLRGRAGFVDVGEGGVPMRVNQVRGNDLPDYGIDLVAEAKPWLQELQEEAKTLEEAYGAYQQRAVHSTSPLIFPTRPHPSTAHPLHHNIKKHISQTRLSQKPKSSCVSESFQPATSSPSPLYDTMITVQTGQPRVTSEDLNELQTTVFDDYSTHTVPKSLQQMVQQPQEGSSSPPRQLSPKLHFGPRVDLPEELSKGTVYTWLSSQPAHKVKKESDLTSRFPRNIEADSLFFSINVLWSGNSSHRCGCACGGGARAVAAVLSSWSGFILR